MENRNHLKFFGFIAVAFAILLTGAILISSSGIPLHPGEILYQLGLTVTVNGTIWYALTVINFSLSRRPKVEQRIETIEQTLQEIKSKLDH